MTIQTTRTRTSRTRARHMGTLAIALSAVLSPAGKIIVGIVAAAALIGGAATQLLTPSPTLTQAPRPVAHTSFRLAQANPPATVSTHIESGGEVMPIGLIEGVPVNNGFGAPTSIPELTFSGLPDGGPSGPGAQSPHFGAPQGGLHPLRPAYNMYPPGFSRPVGHLPSPHNTHQGTPPGNEAPSGGGAGPQNSGAPKTPPTNSPTGPSQLAGPSTPAGKDAPSNEAGAPATPQNVPQTESGPSEESAPANAPNSIRQPETGDPFNPTFPTSDFGPLHTTEQPLPQIRQLSRAAVPEPSMLGLVLVGFAALIWKARRRLSEEGLNLDARRLLVGVVA